MDNDKLFELYVLAELSYKRHFEKVVTEDNLFPKDWYKGKDYKKKIDILTEAIKTNKLIIDIPLYYDMISCVKKKLEK